MGQPVLLLKFCLLLVWLYQNKHVSCDPMRKHSNILDKNLSIAFKSIPWRQFSQNLSVLFQTRIPCLKCGLTFSRSDNLKRHDQDVHQRLRSFVCHLCSQGFARNCHLKQHMFTHHKDFCKSVFLGFEKKWFEHWPLHVPFLCGDWKSILIFIVIPPAQQSCWGYWFHSVRLSVPPSVHPVCRVLCKVYSSGWILTILSTNDHWHERVCRA